MDVRTLDIDDLSLMFEIERSEHVEVEYAVTDGRLVRRPVTVSEIPNWDRAGAGEHTVAAKVNFCRSVIADGGVLLGCFDERRSVGLAVVHPSFEERLAWLAFLHVSRPDRRRGAARALWGTATDLARARGAVSIYVSATPTGSAIGFYLGQGCVLADQVHPTLFANEPDDVHLVCSLA